jgi:hypothetical protein
MWPGHFDPTPTHFFLRLLEEKGVLKRVFTQNIDTLEREAGIPIDRLVEAHGSFGDAHCIMCALGHSQQWIRVDKSTAITVVLIRGTRRCRLVATPHHHHHHHTRMRTLIPEETAKLKYIQAFFALLLHFCDVRVFSGRALWGPHPLLQLVWRTGQTRHRFLWGGLAATICRLSQAGLLTALVPVCRRACP